MGKKGERLLRFLRSSKSKSSSEEVKKNLPSLQDKRAARPNNYFKSAGKAELEMGSDARPHKIDVDYEELIISPEKIVLNDVSTRNKDELHSSTTSKIVTHCTSNIKNGDNINRSKSEHHKSSGNTSYNTPVAIETPPRLPQHPTTKRHPSNSKTGDSSEDDVSEVSLNMKCYKKEFPSKKARSLSNERDPFDVFNDKCMRTMAFQSQTPCTSSTHFSNGSFYPSDFVTSKQPSPSLHGENHSGNHTFAADNQINRKYPINFLQQSHYRHHLPIYVNDEHNVDEIIPQTPRLAFTVTDKEGKGIELTIAVYGASSPCSYRNRSKKDDPLHLIERRNGFQQSTSRRNLPNGVRYENFAAHATCNKLDTQSGYPFIAMSPNPEAMSSISAANALSYHIDGRSYDKAMEGSCLEEIRGDSPKESYKLTQDSITKLKSFFGETMSNDPLKRTVFSSYEDVKKLNELAKILERVEECPWYWGNLTGQDSKKVLTGAEPGTFLLRLSSDPKYLFSLSVKTKRGPTSIRIVHENGYFRFDSELNEAQRQARNSASNGDLSSTRKGHPNYVHRITKKFTCVIHLVLYYTKHLLLNSNEEDNNANGLTVPNDEAVGLSREDRPGELFMCYWVTRSGRKEIPVLLSTPLPKKQFFPSLQSLCRNALSKEHKLWETANQDFIDRKELPTSLRRFIKQYPYPI